MDRKQLETIAGRLADNASPGSRYFLIGELGTGKSVFARAFLRRLGVKGAIPSPSFIVDARYDCSGHEVHHIDLYRLEGNSEQLEFYGIDDILNSDAVVLVEWADRLNPEYLKGGVVVRLAYTDDPEQRRVEIVEEPLAGN